MDIGMDIAALASALLNVAPKVLRRINADVPLTDEDVEDIPGLHDVSELRATPGQLSLLQILVERERCTMNELAEHLAVAPSTVTAMVKRLLALLVIMLFLFLNVQHARLSSSVSFS